MNILFLTCARNGSKGIPNKNLVEVGGKPLMHHTLDFLNTSKCEPPFAEPNITHLVLSTDGEPIASTCQDQVDVIIDRPDELATDTVGRAPVLLHACEAAEKALGCQYDLIFDFLVTAPFRSITDLKACLQLLEDDDVDNVITAVPSHRNPYFNMVELEDGAPKVVKTMDNCVRRQDAPTTYDMNGSIYAWKRAAFLDGAKLFTAKTRLHVMDPSTGLDIDTEHDLNILRSLFS